jgi:hypothetical protein
VAIVRHAVSIDERRWFFRQNLMKHTQGQDLNERWFAGVHCDVGGGYPESDSGLWDCGFAWIVKEAERAGLLLDRNRLDVVLRGVRGADHPWLEPQHESLHGFWWWLAEFFPKWRKPRGARWPVVRCGLGRRRTVPRGALVDNTALRRIRESAYAPPNLDKSFLDAVRALDEAPDCLPYG